MWRNTLSGAALAGILGLLFAGCGGDTGDVVADAQRRVAKEPENVALRIIEVDALLEAEKRNEATLMLNEGLSLAPDDLELLEKMSRLYVDWAWRTESPQKYKTAERYLNRWLEVGGANADAYHLLAWTYNGQGMVQEAIVACKDALGADPEHAGALGEYAQVCFDSGRYEQGLEILARVLEKDPKNERHLTNKFRLEYLVGDYAGSLATLAYIQESAEPGTADWVDEWVAWVTPLTIEGKSEAARRAHDRVGRKHEKILRFDHEIREYQAALDAVDEAGTTKATYYKGEYNFQIGNCFVSVRQPDKALPYLEESVKYLTECNRIDRLVLAYNALKIAYGQMAIDNDSDRDEWLEKKLEANKHVEEYAFASGNNHLALHAIGDIVRTQLDLYGLEGVDPEREKKLEAYMPQEKDIFDCSVGSVVHAAAKLCVAREDFDRARTLYHGILYAEENIGKDSSDSDIAGILGALAHTYDLEGDYESVLKYARSGLDHIALARTQHLVDAFKRSDSANSAGWLHQKVVESALAVGSPEVALTYDERAKGRSLLDLLGTREFLGGKAGAKVRRVEESTQFARVNQLESEAAKVSAAGDELKLRSLQRTLSIERSKYNRLKEDLESAGRAVASFESLPSLEASELVQFVEGFTFVSYVQGNEDLFILVVNQQGVHGVTLEGVEWPHVGSLISDIKDDLFDGAGIVRDLSLESVPSEYGRKPVEASMPNGTDGSSRSRQVLYRKVFQPIEHLIDTELVYICPGESLAFLPFEILEDDDGVPLVDKYTFAYTASGSVLKFCMDREQLGREDFLALGNPNLMNPALRLFNAENEVKVLGGLFPGAQVLTFDAATETAFKQQASSSDVLHLACHGELNEDDPMLTALRLTPDDDNDGYLHAGEIFDLDLRASLVVMSACESGLGDLSTGNELMGLTRAFLYAGAPAVVSSLWKVDDRSTAFLMEAFYKNLTTMNKAEALRQAKIATKQEFPEPFHWAAFRLEGDYR